jgi:hypothetical protein
LAHPGAKTVEEIMTKRVHQRQARHARGGNRQVACEEENQARSRH